MFQPAELTELDVRDLESTSYSPPKDFTSPANQQEKLRLLNSMLLRQVEAKLKDLHRALQNEFRDFGDGVAMDLTKAKAEAALAMTNLLEFLTKFVHSIETSLDIDAMFRQRAVSQEEAIELINLALRNTGLTEKSFPASADADIDAQ